jgi:predicted PurR-regulated permease PerM
LIVLVAVLMGAELAGVIGALGAIPVAGAIQVIVLDWLDHRRQKILDPPGPLPSAADLPS